MLTLRQLRLLEPTFGQLGMPEPKLEHIRLLESTLEEQLAVLTPHDDEETEGQLDVLSPTTNSLLFPTSRAAFSNNNDDADAVSFAGRTQGRSCQMSLLDAVVIALCSDVTTGAVSKETPSAVLTSLG